MSSDKSSKNVETFDYSHEKEDRIASERAPKPVGPYPHARRVGNLLFLSGVGPRKPGTSDIPGVEFNEKGQAIRHDSRLQTQSVIENIQVILEDSGLGLKDVVDVQVFLTDMERDFKGFNEVYAKYFAEVGATRTTVAVSALPTPIAVEFKVIASFE